MSVGVNVTATTSAGSAQITSVSPVTGYADGAAVGGPGIPSGATIVSGAGTSTLTISSPATASATAVGLTVNQSYPAGANGLHVVALDRTTLAPILNQTVTNTTDLHTALTTTGPYATVGHFLPSPGMDDQRLVIIQSVGNGEVTGTATTSLLQDLDELGGTPDLLAGTLAGQKYALVGAATNLPWRNPSALESSTVVPAIPGSSQSQAGEISGAVERDRGGLYAPSSGDPVSPTNTDLPRILYQPAQPWPYVQDTQELNYIADNIGLGAYPDVRSAYLDQNLSESWGLEYSQLSNLNCNDPSQCGSQFDAVKSELLTEFTWVPKVYELGNNLLSPFEQAGAAPYFDVAEVTNQVNASVPVPPASSVSMKWLTIMSDVMEVASGVAAVAGLPASNEFGLIGDAGTLSTDVMEQPNSSGAPADKVTTSAENLAGQMAQLQTAYIQWIGQMETTMLYDYGKLPAVGNAVGNDPAWTWQPTTTLSGDHRAASQCDRLGLFGADPRAVVGLQPHARLRHPDFLKRRHHPELRSPLPKSLVHQRSVPEPVPCHHEHDGQWRGGRSGVDVCGAPESRRLESRQLLWHPLGDAAEHVTDRLHLRTICHRA